MVKFLDLKKITDSFQPELSDAVRRVVDSGWYLQGKENSGFEKEYSDYIGVSHTVGCANGLDALTLIFMAFKELGALKEGDEVIVPANTYIATILSISDNGLVPVLVEPDLSTMQIDAENIESSITEKTRAVMIVHLYGKCAYTDRIAEICERHNLLLIEDNAQAHGCMFGNKRTGSLGCAAAHSFYPGKNLGALGDGGAVTTNDDNLASMVRRLANYGSDRKYVFPSIGINSSLDELQAAVLRVKLKRLDKDNDRRRSIAGRYINEINNPIVRIPINLNPDKDNVYHIFPVLCEKRDSLQKYLSDRGIMTLIHYPIPPHLQECYRGKDILKFRGNLSLTELIHDQELSLPVSPVMTDDEVTEVIEAVNSFR